MAPITEAPPKRIPAWKKLGLKLKFAREEPEDVTTSKKGSMNSKKRKNLSELQKGEPSVTVAGFPPSAATSVPQQHSSFVAVNGKLTSTTKDKPRGASPLVAPRTQSTKLKSVSFTPETKIEDGDGIKQLYKAWYADQLGDDPSFDSSSLNPALKAITPPTITPQNSSAQSLTSPAYSAPTSTSKDQKPGRLKKKSKTKSKPKLSQNSPSISSESQPEHTALTYLTTYHSSPTTWKFSKPHQNYLLKHLFSLTHIPSAHDSALLSYFRGLKGASARQRIREQALIIRAEDDEWLATDTTETEKMENETHEQCAARKRRDYEAAVARVKEMLRTKEDEREQRDWELFGGREEWELRLRKRRRAEVVLWGVGDREEISVGKDAVPPPGHRVLKSQPQHRPQSNAEMREGRRGRGMGMGGVEEISSNGLAKGSRGKKTVFGDYDTTQTNHVKDAQAMNSLSKTNGKALANDGQAKRKRKRKRRTTGVPDDDDSSSSSSSSSSSEDNEDEERAKPVKRQKLEPESSDGETSSSGSGSDSDSDSGAQNSGSSGDSDSE